MNTTQSVCLTECVDFFAGDTCAQVEARGDCDEDVGACCDLTDRSCQDNAPKSTCTGANQRWYKDLPCQSTYMCGCTEDTETGACSERGIGCEDNKPAGECVGSGKFLYKGLSCDDVASICADTDGIIAEFSP